MARIGGLKIVEQKKEEQKKRAADPNSPGQKLAAAVANIRKAAGAGLPLAVYKRFLVAELKEAGVSVEQDVPFPVRYKDLVIKDAFTADIVMGNAIVVLRSDGGDADCRDEAATFLRHSGRQDAYIVNFSAKDPRKMMAKASTRAASISFGPADKAKVN